MSTLDVRIVYVSLAYVKQTVIGSANHFEYIYENFELFRTLFEIKNS